MHLEAFDVLSADIKNKVNIVVKELSSGIMRHGFYNTVVNVKRCFYQFFAV